MSQRLRKPYELWHSIQGVTQIDETCIQFIRDIEADLVRFERQCGGVAHRRRTGMKRGRAGYRITTAGQLTIHSRSYASGIMVVPGNV